MEPLHGRVALVTGGTRGIGRAIARDLAGAGMRVVLTGRDAERAAEAARTLAAEAGVAVGDVLGHAADAWKIQPEDVAEAVRYVLSSPARTLPSRIEVRPARTKPS